MVRSLRALLNLPRQIWWFATARPISWIDDQRVAACRYPRKHEQLSLLASNGITVLVNLHEVSHPPAHLTRYGITEIHLPVPDFTAPTPEQIDRGVAAIEDALQSGAKVAVHCGAGLGRTGTLLACYLLKQGLEPEDAINQVRTARPGSIETDNQEAAIAEFAERLKQTLR